MFKFDTASTDPHYIIQFTPNSGRNINTFNLKETITPNKANKFFKTQVEVSDLKDKTVFFAVAQNLAPSIWPAVNGTDKIPEARLFKIEAKGKLYALYGRISNTLPGNPFNAGLDWQVAPNSADHANSFRKTFFRVIKPGQGRANSRDGVLWQDNTNWKIYLTWFNKTQVPTSTQVENTGNNYLSVAAGERRNNGDIVYITVRISSMN